MTEHFTKRRVAAGIREIQAYNRGFDAGVAAGHRQMLWRMAIGLEVTCYLAQCAEHSLSEVWHGWLRDKALRALDDIDAGKP